MLRSQKESSFDWMSIAMSTEHPHGLVKGIERRWFHYSGTRCDASDKGDEAESRYRPAVGNSSVGGSGSASGRTGRFGLLQVRCGQPVRHFSSSSLPLPFSLPGIFLLFCPLLPFFCYFLLVHDLPPLGRWSPPFPPPFAYSSIPLSPTFSLYSIGRCLF